MDREPCKLPNSPFTGQRLKMASTSERDEYFKTFPMPLPAGHSLRYRWVDDMTVEFGVLPDVPPKPETVAAVEALVELGEGELRARAAELGISLPKKATRQQIAALIRERQVAPQGS